MGVAAVSRDDQFTAITLGLGLGQAGQVTTGDVSAPPRPDQGFTVPAGPGSLTFGLMVRSSTPISDTINLPGGYAAYPLPGSRLNFAGDIDSTGQAQLRVGVSAPLPPGAPSSVQFAGQLNYNVVTGEVSGSAPLTFIRYRFGPLPERFGAGTVTWTVPNHVIDGWLSQLPEWVQDAIFGPPVRELVVTPSRPEPTEEEQPSAPEDQPGFPEEQPSAPDEQPDFPEEQPSAPDEQPNFPEEQPSAPDEQPNFPEEQPSAPDEQPNFPEEQPSLPEEQPGFPEEQPAIAESTDVSAVEPPAIDVPAYEPPAIETPAYEPDLGPGAVVPMDYDSSSFDPSSTAAPAYEPTTYEPTISEPMTPVAPVEPLDTAPLGAPESYDPLGDAYDSGSMDSAYDAGAMDTPIYDSMDASSFMDTSSDFGGGFGGDGGFSGGDF
jgi:hypothetical protein